MSREVLITGASGFIGSQLSYLLTTLGFMVRRTTRSQIYEPSQSAGWITVGDIDNNTDWRSSLDGVEIVVHLAACAHVLRDDKELDSLRSYRYVNTEGTINLARQAAEAGVFRFVFLSSIGVNGAESFQVPFTEKDTPAPHSPYAVSKYEAELGLLKLAKQTNMEVVILRPPLVYGPGAPGNFNTLIRWLAQAKPLPLGAVNNRRSFVSLDNLLDLIVTSINHPAAANQTFLVSDGEDISTTEFLERIGNALDRPARLIPVPPRLLQWAAKLLCKEHVAQKLLGNLQVDIS